MKKMPIILLFILTLIWLNACKEKVNEIDYNPNVLSSKDYIRGEDAIFEIVNAFFKGIHDTLVINQSYGFIDACDVSYHSSENSMIFSFGPVNRMCQDNKFRRGSFHCEFSGPVFNEGVNANIKTDSLFVDDLLIELNLDIYHAGTNVNLEPVYSLLVASSLIMLPDTNKINGVSISTNFSMVWTEGNTTPSIHEDDMYLITGSASGLSSNGYAFTVTVQVPLVNYLDCFWISQGISQIIVPAGEFTTGDIDYILEDGCNNKMYFYFNDNLFYDIIK